MALESATYINGLTETYPTGSDSISVGDDHIRLIKSVLKKTFPGTDQGVNTIHASATAPSTIVADGSTEGTRGMIWYDTSAGLLKINTSDTGTATWVTFGLGAPWLTASDLPSQTGNAGKFLTTNGSAVSWDTTSSPASDACFRAHRNGVAQDMAAVTTYQLIEFTHLDFDEGSGGTAGGDFVEGDGTDESRFVIQSSGAGKYYLHAAILEGAGTGDDDVIAIFKNGVLEAYTNAFATYSGSYGSVSRTRNVACIVSAVAEDYFEVFYQTEHNQGEADISGARTATYFEGYKLT